MLFTDLITQNDQDSSWNDSDKLDMDQIRDRGACIVQLLPTIG